MSSCEGRSSSETNFTSTERTCIYRTELPPESIVVLSIVSALASVSGSLGNALVVIAVFKSENLRSIPDYIISSLAFSDFTVCFIFLPLSIFEFNHYTSQITQQNSAFFIVKNFIGHCSWIASVTNMFIVTIDRFIAIRFPLKYATFASSKTAISAITIVWFISLTFGAVYSRDIGVQSRFIILSFCIILMLCTWAMYVYIFYTAKRQEKRVQTMSPSTESHVSAEQQKAEKKATKTIFTVVGIYALCWLPLLLLPIIVNPSKKELLFKRCFPWVQTVLSCNSALNPYVYCFRSQRYRKHFLKFLGVRYFKNGQSISVSKSLRIQPPHTPAIEPGTHSLHPASALG